jgi:hypothetical protein
MAGMLEPPPEFPLDVPPLLPESDPPEVTLPPLPVSAGPVGDPVAVGPGAVATVRPVATAYVCSTDSRPVAVASPLASLQYWFSTPTAEVTSSRAVDSHEYLTLAVTSDEA